MAGFSTVISLDHLPTIEKVDEKEFLCGKLYIPKLSPCFPV
jgi:hypothetical protein